MPPPFQGNSGQGLANKNPMLNYHTDLSFQSPQHNTNTEPNSPQAIGINPISECVSNQVHPIIENGWNRPSPMTANGPHGGGQPMEFNHSEPHYPRQETYNQNANTPFPLEENEQNSQQWPEALQQQSNFNARFQQPNMNASQIPPQATIANAPTPHQLHQWVNGSSRTLAPIAAYSPNPRLVQGESDNGLGFGRLNSNGGYTPQRRIPVSKLRTQLISVAREIKLRTVESINAPSEHVQPQGDEELFMLYLVVLGQYILQGGCAWYTNLPPPASNILTSPRATNSFSSSPIPFKLDKIKRESQTNDGIDGNQCVYKEVSPIDTTDLDTVLQDPNLFELDDIEHPAPLDSGGALVDPDYFNICSEESPSISINDGGSHSSSSPQVPGNPNASLSTPSTRVRSLSPCAPVFVPASEGHQTISCVDDDHGPLVSTDNKILSKSHSEPAKALIYCPRMNSVSFVNEKILTDPFVTKNSSNTSTPSMGSIQRNRSYLSTPLTPISPSLHASPSTLGSPSPRERFVAQGPMEIPSNICFIRTKHYVMGSASWFYSQLWVPRPYHEILTRKSFKRLEELKQASTQSAPELSTIPTGYVDFYGKPIFFQAGNSRPEPKPVLCPSSDDLDVNWNATPAERRRIRLTKKRQMWVEWQERARDVRFFWYLREQWGQIKGWTETNNGCGNNAKAEEMDMSDHYKLMIIVQFTSKQGFGTIQISSEDKKKILNGRSIKQFNRDWEETQRKFGNSNWSNEKTWRY
ncbi:uncharacterized protein EAE97_009582 [Botrytis byssoidea]|uniref:Uncharacterized protein n=1 Tax=Botrytis byssoidea TaxID=139641 RepID=A0A9P5I2K8_9HELO|nr:uncharacterized protein EAE97_009582 [Botrytis byssoidea]KAF7929985.1 hypothetical protein EAE97_009582 [Botrytis byssoidea]